MPTRSRRLWNKGSSHDAPQSDPCCSTGRQPCTGRDGSVLFSLGNTDFVVLLAFLLFVGVLIYLKVPGLLMGLLDKRADTIRAELDEARALREEAQTPACRFRA